MPIAGSIGTNSTNNMDENNKKPELDFCKQQEVGSWICLMQYAHSAEIKQNIAATQPTSVFT